MASPNPHCVYVVEFSEFKPYKDIKKYVCIPSHWVTSYESSHGRVLVAFPDESPNQTKERVRKGENHRPQWDHFWADFIKEFDHYNNAVTWIATNANVKPTERRPSISEGNKSHTEVVASQNNQTAPTKQSTPIKRPVPSDPRKKCYANWEKQSKLQSVLPKIIDTFSMSEGADQAISSNSVVIPQDTATQHSQNFVTDWAGQSVCTEVASTETAKCSDEEASTEKSPATESSNEGNNIEQTPMQCYETGMQSISNKLNTMNENMNENFQRLETIMYKMISENLIESFFETMKETENKDNLKRKVNNSSEDDDVDDGADDASDDHEDTRNNYSVLKRHCNEHYEDRYKKINLPSGYTPYDTKWTLQYQMAAPGVVELRPQSAVFIDVMKFANCLGQETNDCKLLAKMLLKAIFTREALSVCSFRPRHLANGGHRRPELDEHASNELLAFVEDYGRCKGWAIYKKIAITHALNLKINNSRSKRVVK